MRNGCAFQKRHTDSLLRGRIFCARIFAAPQNIFSDPIPAVAIDVFTLFILESEGLAAPFSRDFEAKNGNFAIGIRYP